MWRYEPPSPVGREAPAIGDRAAANSSADSHVDEVIHALAGAKLPLADCCGDTVIFKANRKGKALLKLRLQREVRETGKGRNVPRNPATVSIGPGADTPIPTTFDGWDVASNASTRPWIWERMRSGPPCASVRSSSLAMTLPRSSTRAPWLAFRQVYPDGNLLHVRTKFRVHEATSSALPATGH